LPVGTDGAMIYIWVMTASLWVENRTRVLPNVNHNDGHFPSSQQPNASYMTAYRTPRLP
jgi:hypothetical protein